MSQTLNYPPTPNIRLEFVDESWGLIDSVDMLPGGHYKVQVRKAAPTVQLNTYDVLAGQDSTSCTCGAVGPGGMRVHFTLDQCIRYLRDRMHSLEETLRSYEKSELSKP